MRRQPPNSGWISRVDAFRLAYQRLGTLRGAYDVLLKNEFYIARKWVPADPALDPRILRSRDKVEAIPSIGLKLKLVEILTPKLRFETEKCRIIGKPEDGELFYQEEELRNILDLLQKAEALTVSPEPATPNDKRASAPATGAEVLAEFPVGVEQAQSVVKSAKPQPERIARVTPKCPPMSQRIRYSLWQGITDEFPDGVPVTMTVPDVARQLAENGPLIARGIKKKNLTGGKHDVVLKRLLERTRK